MSEQNGPKLNGRLVEETTGIQFACDRNPDFGLPFMVSPGIWWVRLPVASALQAINVYLLEDGKGLTLVDTGVRSAECRQALQTALSHSDLENFRLSRVIVTHYHPDHIGLAGELIRDGVELWTSRSTWLNCHLHYGNKQLLPQPSEIAFMQRAGITGIDLEAFRRRASNRFSAQVAPPPDHYVPLVDGQLLNIGKRSWRVALSYGHAAEHVSLWSYDCVLSGDQILPSIASNLTVPYTECDADLIGEWLRSCRSLMPMATSDLLCLPGHQRPFYGIDSRLQQIEDNIHKTLERLQSLVTQPVAAIDCVEGVYGRSLASDERRSLLPEVVGMLNHLYFHGKLGRNLDGEGVYRYSTIESKSSRRGKGFRVSQAGANDVSTDSQQNQKLPQDHVVPYEPVSGEDKDANFDPDSEFNENSAGSRLPRLAALFAMCLVGGAIYWKWDTFAEQVTKGIGTVQDIVASGETGNNQQAAVVVTPVETFEVTLETKADVPRQFTGVVKPRRASQIGFNRVGVIDEILVERGDRVEADTILAKLNTNSLKANLKAIQAQYRAAEARLSELVAGPRAQTIESAKAKVAASKAELELAKNSLNRAQRLVDAGAVSKQDLDNAQTNAAAKEEALKADQNTLDELLEGTRSEQVLAQRAQLAELEAAQEQLQVQLNESVLRAPFTATVSDRFVEPGAVAAPGSFAFRLIDAESPEVWIGVSPEFITTIQKEKNARLAIGDQSYTANLKSVLPELDEVTRTNTVIFELSKSVVDSSLFGQVARIELSRKIDQKGFWVPTAALTQGDQGLWALLALLPTDNDQEFVLKRQEVEIIQVDSERVFVRGTVEPGTRLVATGVRRLTPGQKVGLRASQPAVITTSAGATEHPKRSVTNNEGPLQ